MGKSYGFCKYWNNFIAEGMKFITKRLQSNVRNGKPQFKFIQFQYSRTYSRTVIILSFLGNLLKNCEHRTINYSKKKAGILFHKKMFFQAK